MTEDAVPAADKFDLKVHTRDKRGRLLSENPYRLHMREGISYFERPVGSGNLFYENNEPAGRVELIKDERTGKTVGKKFDREAPHKEYVAPLTGTEKLHFAHASLTEENAKLRAELESIRAERDAKQAQAKTIAPKVAEPEAPKAEVNQVPTLKKGGQ